jgi:hypothetical protein
MTYNLEWREHKDVQLFYAFENREREDASPKVEAAPVLFYSQEGIFS